jgi:outer membrane immunogenic protein
VKKFLLAGIAAATLCGAPALAAPPAPLFNWNGFYVGGTGGGAWTSAGVTLNTVNGTSPLYAASDIPGLNALGSPTLNDFNGIYGGKVGFNSQSGIYVFGIEADYSSFHFSKSKFSTGDPFVGFPAPPGLASFTTSVSTSWLATVRPRIGFTVNSSSLVYFTGGAAFGNVRFANTYLGFSPSGAGFEGEASAASGTKAGWVLGWGVDTVFAPNWIASLEFLHVELAALHAAGLVTTGNANTATFNFSTKIQSDIVRLGLAYKFGG